MNALSQNAKRFLKRNAPTILTCIGSAGVVLTAVLTAKAVPKATELLKEAEIKKGEELTKFETVLAATPAYVPAVVTGAASIACIFGANVLNTRKQASLMSAYALLDNSFKEYKKHAEELYGEDASAQIRREIAKDYYDSEDRGTEDDTILFFDNQSMRYFESTMEDVVRAEYLLNRELNMFSYVCLNQFYDLLKIPTVEGGDELGWSAYDMSAMYWNPWIDFNHEKVVMDDGLECYIISFRTEPIADYLDY
jgi:hypothetical protein